MSKRKKKKNKSNKVNKNQNKGTLTTQEKQVVKDVPANNTKETKNKEADTITQKTEEIKVESSMDKSEVKAEVKTTESANSDNSIAKDCTFTDKSTNDLSVDGKEDDAKNKEADVITQKTEEIKCTDNNSADKENEKIINTVNLHEKVKSKDPKKSINRKLVLSHVTVAVISSLASCTLLKLHLEQDITTTENLNSNSTIQEEFNHSVSDIMDKIESNNLIKIKPTYPLDYTFDSIFDNIRDDALAIETSVLLSKDNLQEIFIIKTPDTDTAESELQKYKESLITMYKDKGQKEELKIAKNIIIESKKDITYFIAAENCAEIKELINKEIK